MNFQTIHEANFLSDMLKAVADSDISFISDIGKRILGQKDPNEINISRNIAKSAAALTATFPVIVTEATQLEHAVMVSKAIERKAVEMLRMLFAANQITNVTGAQAYLNKFHSNMDYGTDLSDMDVDDVIEYSNRIHESELPGYDYELEALTEQAKQAVIQDTKTNILYTLESTKPTTSIREFRVRGKLNEADVWWSNPDLEPNLPKVTNILQELRIEADSKVQTRYEGDPDSIFTDKQVTITQDNPNSPESLKYAYDTLNKGVLPTDIKKANEAVPSMVVVNFVSTIPGGRTVTSVAVVGVKAVLHYVSSEDMINRVVLKKSDNNTLLNFIRATTREISFFNDFLFATKRAKIDAVAKSGRGSNSKIWKILEIRADRSKLNRAAGKKNTDCAAISTIVISRAEVDLIKKEHRIDLMKPGQFVSIMRGYNFMCGVIVDDVAERVDFMWDDGTKNFETLSFSSLEREDSNGSLKKVINIMANNRR